MKSKPMNRCKLIIVLLTTLIVLVCVIFALRINNCRSMVTEVYTDYIVERDKLNEYNTLQKQKLYLEGEKLEDARLLNSDNEYVRISSILNSSKLVFRYSDQYCNSCIESAIQELKEFGQNNWIREHHHYFRYE